MPLYDATVPPTKKMLTNLASWLDKAEAHAKAKGFEPDNYLGLRLAPDQYTFVKQIQGACDAAKFVAARLTGKEAPKHPDTEATFGELRTRIQSVIDYLGTFEAKDFDGADERLVMLPFLEGKGLRSSEYLNGMALPNFYFHTVTAYAILRHAGVDLGKRDFIGGLELVDP